MKVGDLVYGPIEYSNILKQKKIVTDMATIQGIGKANYVVVDKYGQIGNIKKRQACRYVCHEQQQVDDFVSMNIDVLTVEIKRAIEFFHLEKEVGKCDFGKDNIHLLDGYIVIDGGFKLTKTIGKMIEQPCWVVTKYVPTSGTYDEPPDVADSEIGKSISNRKIVQFILDELHNLRIGHYFEMLNEAELAEIHLEA